MYYYFHNAIKYLNIHVSFNECAPEIYIQPTPEIMWGPATASQDLSLFWPSYRLRTTMGWSGLHRGIVHRELFYYKMLWGKDIYLPGSSLVATRN